MLPFLIMKSMMPCNLSVKRIIVLSHYLFATVKYILQIWTMITKIFYISRNLLFQLTRTSFLYAMIFYKSSDN
ncbi:odorant receptor 47a-like [Vespula maculifrons]|uniref:Odorant receptor 47a-like n=1 Tax=Vespula maculifrons TaxID=7453 RepID=A0ABD2BPN6_VESMC